MTDGTRAYLDGEWTAVPSGMATRGIGIYGPDGDPIIACNCWNAAHLLTPADVAEYLMELHAEHVARLKGE